MRQGFGYIAVKIILYGKIIVHPIIYLRFLFNKTIAPLPKLTIDSLCKD
jgi:hypothetical protein